jgi:hypothetical protein
MVTVGARERSTPFRTKLLTFIAALAGRNIMIIVCSAATRKRKARLPFPPMTNGFPICSDGRHICGRR